MRQENASTATGIDVNLALTSGSHHKILYQTPMKWWIPASQKKAWLRLFA